MALPSKITTRREAVDALAQYAAWRVSLLDAESHRKRGILKATGASLEYLDRLDDGLSELPPRAPRVVVEPVDVDSPPVAYFADRRVTVVRPLQGSSRSRWTVGHPLASGVNGARVEHPGPALAAVVSDLDQLAAVRAACAALASRCRAAGLVARGDIWQQEADELGAFAVRHEQDTVPTVGAAWLAEWRALDVSYPAPAATPPVRRPTIAAHLR